MLYPEDNNFTRSKYYKVMIHECTCQNDQTVWSSYEQTGILFLLSGDCLFETNKSSIPVKESHIMIIAPEEVHKLKKLNEDCFVAMIILINTNIEKLLGNHGAETCSLFLAQAKNTYVIDSVSHSTQWIILSAEKLYDQIIRHEIDKEFYCISLAGLIIYEVMYLYIHTTSSQGSIFSEKNDYDNSVIIKKAIQYINLNYHKDINLDKIAKNLWVNPSYLSRQFKNKVGVNITEFITAKRIFTAKNLLISTDLKISDIALSVGYGNIPYFNTVFKRNIELSPTQFRKKYKCGLNR